MSFYVQNQTTVPWRVVLTEVNPRRQKRNCVPYGILTKSFVTQWVTGFLLPILSLPTIPFQSRTSDNQPIPRSVLPRPLGLLKTLSLY